MERDRLLSPNLINTESYFEEEDPGEVNNGVSTDTEQLNINVTSKPLHLLKDCPTKLIEELVKIFELFDQATEAFSAEKYPTFDSDSDNEEAQTLEIYDIQLIIACVKQAIYNSLWKYWGKPKYTGLLAILLDLWLKKMCFWPSYLHEKTIRICCKELDSITDTIPIQSTSFT
ncbi:18170_t:CDS:2, partial [Dentiscutata erythropus]